MNDIHHEIGRLQNTINDLIGQRRGIEDRISRGISANPRRDGWLTVELGAKAAKIRAMQDELRARIARGRTHEPLPSWWTEV